MNATLSPYSRNMKKSRKKKNNLWHTFCIY